MKKLGTIIILSFLTACTQPPAELVDKTGMFFGRDGEQMAYSEPTHETATVGGFLPVRNEVAYSTPAQNVTVAVNDLPPPSPAPQRIYSAPIVQSREIAAEDMSYRKPLSEVTIDTSRQAQTSASHAQGALVKATSSTGNIIRDSAHNSVGQFIWPVQGRVISHFGPKDGGKYNDGINISSAEGEPIWSAADGQVVYAGNEVKGYGNMVLIKHNDGWITAYAHAKSLDVKQGEYVKQGDIIGYVGVSGGVKDPQLHFAIRKGRDPVDPEKYLTRDVAVLN